MFKNMAIWLVIGIVLMTVFNQFNTRQAVLGSLEYSQFLEEVKQGRITKVVIQGRTLEATTTDGKRITTYAPPDLWMVSDLLKNNVKVVAKPEEEQSFLTSIFVSWFPMLLLIGVWVFFMRQMQGGGKGGAFSFGKSRARMMDESSNTITFADVAGCDEAKEEVYEMVDFLRDPTKFQKLGGRIPRGVLLVGSPGTGKTLLAKAIAGEAKVPFFSISGSDFVEMFVGVGAARVRDMFDQAKKAAPCIIFIDELDAVGRQRGAGLGGGNDEREQTLNQMLVEMDGFEGSAGVIVVAATNRPDVLDPALLRPGRFDRQVVVPLPDIRGREQILKVHMRKVPVAPDIDASILARGCPGFSGADLANLVNEAALFAARSNKRLVDMEDFERAKDKIMMGAERRSMVMPEEERRNTAYHESGHAVVAKLLPKTDPVHKVTDHSARSGAGPDHAAARPGTLQPGSRPPAQHHHRAVRRPHCRGTLHAADDHRRVQRLPARHRPGAAHGDAVGHVRQPGSRWCMAKRKARSSSAAPSPPTRTFPNRPCRRSITRSAASSTNSTRARANCWKTIATRSRP
jgi:cell division protease FtsH